MENKTKKDQKLTFTNIFFLSVFGLFILIFKYNMTKVDICHQTCSNINSELDIIRCLDVCAANGEEFREPLSFNRVIFMLILVILLGYLFYQFINNFVIRRDGREKLLKLIRKIKDFKDRLLYKHIYEKYGYKKLDD